MLCHPPCAGAGADGSGGLSPAAQACAQQLHMLQQRLQSLAVVQQLADAPQAGLEASDVCASVSVPWFLSSALLNQLLSLFSPVLLQATDLCASLPVPVADCTPVPFLLLYLFLCLALVLLLSCHRYGGFSHDILVLAAAAVDLTSSAAAVDACRMLASFVWRCVPATLVALVHNLLCFWCCR
jgi:hypothetical protein